MTPTLEARIITRLAQELWEIEREGFRNDGSEPGHYSDTDTGDALPWREQDADLRQFLRRRAKRLLRAIREVS